MITNDEKSNNSRASKKGLTGLNGTTFAVNDVINLKQQEVGQKMRLTKAHF